MDLVVVTGASKGLGLAICKRLLGENYKVVGFQEGVALKCNLCYERIDKGLEPACVITCITTARVFGDLNDPYSEVNRLIRQRNGFQPLPECNTDPSVYYID